MTYKLYRKWRYESSYKLGVKFLLALRDVIITDSKYSIPKIAYAPTKL